LITRVWGFVAQICAVPVLRANTRREILRFHGDRGIGTWPVSSATRGRVSDRCLGRQERHTSLRHQYGDHSGAVPPVDKEIGVESEDLCSRVDFRQSNQARIRQGHRSVPIAPHESPQIPLLLLDSERDTNHSPLQQSKRASASRPSRFSRKAASLRTGSHVSSGGRSRFHCSTTTYDALRRRRGNLPATGVEQARAFRHSPKPFMYFGLSARSLAALHCTGEIAGEVVTRDCPPAIGCAAPSPGSPAPARISLSASPWLRPRVGRGDHRAVSVKSSAYFRVIRPLCCAIPRYSRGLSKLSRWPGRRWRTMTNPNCRRRPAKHFGYHLPRRLSP